MTAPNEIELHEYQSKAMLSDKRIIALIAGTGGGKTWFGTHWVWTEYARNMSDALIVAPTYKVLNQATMRTFVAETKRVYGDYGQYFSQSGEFRTRWGHIFYCRTAMKPEHMEGLKAGIVWGDEASLYKADVWPIMLGRGAMYHARYLLTTTPKGLNWLYHDIYKPFKNGDPDIEVVQYRSIDNPFYDQAEADLARRRMRHALYRMRYEGRFEKLEGLVYDNAQRERLKHRPFNVPKGWDRWAAVDFGVNHAFVCAWFAHNPSSGKYYVTNLYYRRGLYIQDNVKAMKRKGRLDNLDIIYAGAKSEVQQRDDLRRALRDVGVETAVKSGYSDDVMIGIAAVYGLINEHKLKIVEKRGMEPLWNEFELYQYKEDNTGRYTKDEIKKEDDDCMDTLRYGLATRLRRRKVQEIWL